MHKVTLPNKAWALASGILLLCLSVLPAQAVLHATAGRYHIALAAQPQTPPAIGAASLLVQLTDSTGKPVSGAALHALTQMPGMPMGETMQTGSPVTGEPGVYSIPAKFAMGGTYHVQLAIQGPKGSARAVLSLPTGVNTGTLALPAAPSMSGRAANPPTASNMSGMAMNGHAAPMAAPAPAVSWLIAGYITLAAAALWMLTAAAKRKAREGKNGVSIAAGSLLVLLALVLSHLAVDRFTQPGHMSVIEAQSMDMSAMKPPAGAVPVAAERVKPRKTDVYETVNAVAVPYSTQIVAARITGTMQQMPLYPGDAVAAGEQIAVIDPRQLNAQTAVQQAGVIMAKHNVDIARLQKQQAQQMAAAANAEVQSALSKLAEVKAEEQSRQAAVQAAVQQVGAAKAMLKQARAEQGYQKSRFARDHSLLKGGSLSLQEYQQDYAAEQSTQAGVESAKAGLAQAQAAVQAAQAALLQAQARISVRTAALNTARQNAAAMQTSAETAAHEIIHKQAGLQMARAARAEAQVQQSYTHIDAAFSGVVVSRLTAPGSLVRPGQPILKIAQINPLRIQAQVAVQDLQHIHVGTPVQIQTEDGAVLNTRITSVFPEADTVTHTAVVEALTPNPHGKLLPGQMLQMRIRLYKTADAITIPTHALAFQPVFTSPVLAEKDSTWVWVVQQSGPVHTVYTCTMHHQIRENHPGKCPICGWKLVPEIVGGEMVAHETPVQTGAAAAGVTTIVNGLQPDDMVITHGLQGLREGEAVVLVKWGQNGPLQMPTAEQVRHEDRDGTL